MNEDALVFCELVVIGADGEQLGILASSRALDIACEMGLDLVVISTSASPPIARIIDYNKFSPLVQSGQIDEQWQRPRISPKMKRVIVCGASSGIGRATAVALSESGCELVLVARRRALLEELAAQCEKNGAKTICVPCDITQYTECEEFVRIAKLDSDGVEPVLVNSAGVAEFGNFATMSVTSIDDQIRTNLLGPVYACRAFIPWVLEAGSGQIVNVLSISASTVFAGAAAYSASKAGLLMFGKSLASEYRKQGLRLTSVLPGATDTAIWANQSFVPTREDMLSAEAVADCIRDVILMPADRSVDEITMMPPKGIL
ncbi:MAG TPA: SDR family NAD(P)-dependent oxidoreductase [Fimbriimonadaceae bacterium]|jgi:3-oxoacyl-[acyl-carrier protein] reductase